MNTTLRSRPLAATRSIRQLQRPLISCAFSISHPSANGSQSQKAPSAPDAEAEALSHGKTAPTYLGTTKRLPEFNLVDKIVIVSGAARGLGLVQAEALLEAGATGMFDPRPMNAELTILVYALDRLEEPSADFFPIQKRAKEELGTSLEYHRIDVRDVEQLNKIVEAIADKHGRMDGCLAAAGIQQETTALDYTAEDSNTMMSVNVTGCFMTAQAAARQMVKFGNGGSIVMIASMSGTVANRVRAPLFLLLNIRADANRDSSAPPTMLPKQR
jgi:NADP-dependent 3-hydroxy acid dehydrogenase YdfG